MAGAIKLFSGIIILMHLASCSISGLQTAKPVAKKTADIGVAGGMQAFGEEPVGILEIWGRYGIADKADIGIKVSGPFPSAQADFKYQFHGDQNSKIALASGGIVSIGFERLTIGVPLYTSIHPAENVAFYLSSRGGITYMEYDYLVPLLSLNTGVVIGKSHRARLILDAAYLKNFGGWGEGVVQGSAGMAFNIGWKKQQKKAEGIDQ